MEGIGGGNAARNPDPSTFDPLNDEFTRLDPATYTPFDTVVTGEETTGGHAFEITNPWADDAAVAGVRWLDKVPAVAHEGIRFDSAGTMYCVDENNSGSVYKFVPWVPGDLSVGQSYVLAVNAFTGNPDENWDSATNSSATRTGAATWVPITDAVGNPVTTVDPFIFADAGIGVVPTGTAGRAAADELNGTPYGRPEDVIINKLNGTEVLYFTATSEDAAYSVILNSATTVVVKVFADRSTINVKTGEAVGPAFNNLGIDARPVALRQFFRNFQRLPLIRGRFAQSFVLFAARSVGAAVVALKGASASHRTVFRPVTDATGELLPCLRHVYQRFAFSDARWEIRQRGS